MRIKHARPLKPTLARNSVEVRIEIAAIFTRPQWRRQGVGRSRKWEGVKMRERDRRRREAIGVGSYAAEITPFLATMLRRELYAGGMNVPKKKTKMPEDLETRAKGISLC